MFCCFDTTKLVSSPKSIQRSLDNAITNDKPNTTYGKYVLDNLKMVQSPLTGYYNHVDAYWERRPHVVANEPPVTRFLRLSTASNELLQPIAFENNTYQCDEYTCLYLQDKRQQKKFTVELVINNMTFAPESSPEVFSIRDTAMSELIDFTVASSEQLSDLAIKLTIFRWPQTLAKLYAKHPELIASMQPTLVDAYNVTRRSSLLMAFPPDVSPSASPIPPSAPISLASPSAPTPFMSPISLASPSAPPPPYEEESLVLAQTEPTPQQVIIHVPPPVAQVPVVNRSVMKRRAVHYPIVKKKIVRPKRSVVVVE